MGAVSRRKVRAARDRAPAVARLFRPEALEAAERGAAHGAALRLSPSWIGWSSHLLLAIAVAGLLFVLLARVGDHAHGPAVVRVVSGRTSAQFPHEGSDAGRLDLTTASGGLLEVVAVDAGQKVQRGQLLVRLQASSERRELEQVEREFDLALVRSLLSPGDAETRQGLSGLRAARDLAAARLRERELRAPRAGVVRNLRIRPGQLLAPGDLVLTLVDESRASFAVVALLPGQFRPMVEPGMKLRFALEGYPQVASALEVESVGEEAIGPQEARRYLGRELGDALPAGLPSEGSLVLVRARLPERHFRFDGRTYGFHEGLPGRVDVKVRSQRLITLLFPALRALTGRGESR